MQWKVVIVCMNAHFGILTRGINETEKVLILNAITYRKV